MKNIKWLLAGAGDIARRRAAAALREAANSVITAICDPVPGKAADLAERMGVNAVFTDYAQALDQSGADAVYIASPVFCHHDMCIMAAEHGIPFLCEKPLALCGAEAARILRAAKRNKVTAACSNYRVFCGQYQLTRQIIESGEVGALRGGRACYIQMPFNPNRRQLREALGDSPVRQLGFYVLDIIRRFLGMPQEVFARCTTFPGNDDPGWDLDDITSMILFFPNGGQFTFVVHYAHGTSHEFELFGSKGRIRWPNWPPHGNEPVQVISGNGPDGIRELPAVNAANFHLPLVEDFIAALQQGRQPVCSLDEAVATEYIIDAIFQSAASGRPEAVHRPDQKDFE